MIPAGDRRYRVIWIKCDPRTGAELGTCGVIAPGPFTHAEACTVLRKVTSYPWRRDMIEEITDGAGGGGS